LLKAVVVSGKGCTPYSSCKTLRIRIWSELDGVETDVYDNGFDQELGGSIVIHTMK
jgi:hypothetical protein